VYSGGGDNGAAAQEAATQAALQQGTDTVNKQFAQFTPDFYQQAAKAYTNYATPQAYQQYRQTGQTLTGNLASNQSRNFLIAFLTWPACSAAP